MIRKIALLFLIAVPIMGFAQLDSQFKFTGQNAESLHAEKRIVVVTPETVQVPHTCSRQVPVGDVQVCHNEIRYRQDCINLPPSEICRMESERICRQIPRVREECTGERAREVCTERPSREVCRERPSSQVCKRGPRGVQICTTIGGGRECTQVGGGRDCRTIPGDHRCRQVSYMDTDCDNVARRRCDYVPSRLDCRQISYNHPVCRIETQFRTENYTCTRTETVERREEKTLKNDIDVQVITNGLVEEFQLTLSAKEHSREFKEFSLDVQLNKQPKIYVILKKKNIQVVSESKSEISLKSSLVLEILEAGMVNPEFPESIASASIEKDSQKLTVVLNGGISGEGSLDLKLTHKTFIFPVKTLAAFSASYPSDRAELVQAGDKAALKIQLGQTELKEKNMKLELKLSAELRLSGRILNDKKPVTEKSYEGIEVSIN
jgi:hypothetical protein